MDPTTLDILSRASEGPCKLDKTNPVVRSAAEALKSGEYIRLDFDWCATITGKGRAALVSYHAEQKQIDKQRAEDTSKRRTDYKRQLITVILGAIVGSVVTLILQYLFHVR